MKSFLVAWSRRQQAQTGPRCLQSASPSVGSGAILQLAYPCHRKGPAFSSHCAGKNLGAGEAVRPLPLSVRCRGFAQRLHEGGFFQVSSSQASPGRTGHMAALGGAKEGRCACGGLCALHQMAVPTPRCLRV